MHKLSLGVARQRQARWKRFRLVRRHRRRGVALHRLELRRRDAAPISPTRSASWPASRDGVEAGAFVEGTVELVPRRLLATAGVRADVYHAHAVTLLGVDPRLQFRAKLLAAAHHHRRHRPLSAAAELSGAAARASTPSRCSSGLQRAIQAAYGVEAELPQDRHRQGHRLLGAVLQRQRRDARLLDAVVCTSPPPESLTGFAGAHHAADRRPLVRHGDPGAQEAGRFTGWIAYTLSRTERIYSCGLRPPTTIRPTCSTSSVQVRLPWHLMVGARFLLQTRPPGDHARSATTGAAATRNNTRLPDYYQLDFRIDREWIFKRWALSVFLEIVNLTYSQSVIGITYPTEPIR